MGHPGYGLDFMYGPPAPTRLDRRLPLLPFVVIGEMLSCMSQQSLNVYKATPYKGIFLLVCLVLGGVASYDGLDDAGWIARTRNIDMNMAPNWMNNESRVCHSIQTFGSASKPAQLVSLYCPIDTVQGPAHNLSIRLWGKVSRPDISGVEAFRGGKGLWRCARRGDDFTCWAIN